MRGQLCFVLSSLHNQQQQKNQPQPSQQPSSARDPSAGAADGKDGERDANSRDHGAQPAFLGYRGFPACICVSINDEVVHGIPGSRVVQEGEFIRVGGTRQLNVEARIISASNKDLHKAIAEGRFREDLYYRLSVVQIAVPPLRQRAEDIPLLAAHFVRVYAAQVKKRVQGIHPDAMALLLRYQWPGNIRELENVVERAVIMAEDGEPIQPEDLPGDLVEERAQPDGPMGEVRGAEREAILRALRECGWNHSLAARKLGIGRRTLYDKLARLGLSLHPQ